MIEYFIIVGASILFAGIACMSRGKWMFFLFASMSVACFMFPAMIRYGVGFDYLLIYTPAIEAIENGFAVDQEWSFRLIVEFVLRYLGERHWVFVIYSVLTYLVAVFSFPKKGFGWAVASYLFMYYAFTLSGIRQGLALSFCFWSIVLYLRKNRCLSVLMIIVAVFWHKSAAILLPLLLFADFFSRMELPFMPLFLGLVAAVLWCLDLSDIMLKVIGLTPYARYLDEGGENISIVRTTTGLGYLIPAMIFLTLSYVFYSMKGRTRHEKLIGALCGLAVLFFGVSKNVSVFNRFSIIGNAVIPFAVARLSCMRRNFPEGVCLAFVFLCMLAIFCKEIISDANYGIVPFATIFDERISLW